MLKAFITNLGKYNEGALVGEWISFPITQETLTAVLNRIGIGPEYEEYFFTDYECEVDGVYDVLGEYENVRELNYLGHSLNELGCDQSAFEAALSDHGARSIKELINLAGNLELFYYVPDIRTKSDLGEFLVDNDFLEVPEHLVNYIDYEAVGRDHLLDGGGALTDCGYVEFDGSTMDEIYDGEEIPEEYDIQPARAPTQEMQWSGGP